MSTSVNKLKVQLTGHDGNAFNILARCRNAAIEAGWRKDQIAAVLDEMKAGDYDNLLATAVKHFDVN